jgi:hypothetical protein
MVSQRARDRGEKNKAVVAGRLTKRSNPEIIAALVYCMRQFKPGEWTPGEAISAHYKTLNRRMNDAVYCARRMLTIHCDKKTGRYYMRRHPEIELEKFGLRWVDWSQLNPDLCCDRTILAFELEHQDLWLRVKSFLLGEDVCSIEGCYTPWREPTQTELVTMPSSDPFNAGLQAEICEKLSVNDSFVAGVQAKAAQPNILKPGPPKSAVREVNGQRFKKPVEDPNVAGKHILGEGPRYQYGRDMW